MIKLFACDLDGTLLNWLHATDKVILDAVREITDAGAHIAIATGRTMRTAYDSGFQGAPIELLGSNGSIVRDRDGHVLKTFPIDHDVLEDLLRAFPTVCFECVAPDGTFVTGSQEQREEGFRNRSLMRRIIMRGMRGTSSEQEYMWFNQTADQVLEHEVCKINCHVLDPVLNRELASYLAENIDKLVDAPFAPTMFEISACDVNKGAGVAWLAQYLGISEDEVAVYGDGGNDIRMLERFEHAYAPKNASDAAKRAAGTVIGSNVFHAVPKHMLRTLRDQRSRTVIA